LRYSRWWLGCGALLAALVIAGSLAPLRGFALGNDKAAHLCAYLVLALWFGGVYRPRRYPAVAAALVALGLAVELLQGQIGYRRMDVADMGANAAGVLTGITLAWLALGSWCQWVEARLPGSP
jgi:VanZ family protein